MPRRRKSPSSVTEPQTVAAVLAASPIGQILASHDARAEIEPDQTMPEHEAALAAFQRQHEPSRP